MFGWETVNMMEAVVRTPQGQPGDEESDWSWIIRKRMVNRLLLNLFGFPKDDQMKYNSARHCPVNMRQATYESHQPLPPIAAGCRNTQVWGGGSWCRRPWATCVVLAAREDVSRRWVERGRRGRGREGLQGAKPHGLSPTGIPTDICLIDEFLLT